MSNCKYVQQLLEPRGTVTLRLAMRFNGLIDAVKFVQPLLTVSDRMYLPDCIKMVITSLVINVFS